MELLRRALKLKFSAHQVVNSPVGVLMPVNVRSLINDLAALVCDLAAAVEKGGSDHGN